ncbi:MAG: hypothetical protein K8F30_00130, partial [Taibaiella sp.]|nr:hypothetical protein [Taibaiella sp.]
PVNILLIVVMALLSSCVKNWNCTCSHYIQHSDTSGTVTTLHTNKSTIAGTKKSAQKDCKYAEQIGKDEAVVLGLTPEKVNCTFK